MNEFNQRFKGLSTEQKQARYRDLAKACLAHYSLSSMAIKYIGHNSGIAYQINTHDGKFLLKIAEATGEEESDANPEYINGVLSWLSAMANETNLTVQKPVANRLGKFVTAVTIDDLSQPFYCMVQHWLVGQPLRNPSPEQIHQIGQMMAQLHNHGSGWIKDRTTNAWMYDDKWTNENFARFKQVKSLDVLSESEWENIEKAVNRIHTILNTTDTRTQSWGHSRRSPPC